MKRQPDSSALLTWLAAIAASVFGGLLLNAFGTITSISNRLGAIEKDVAVLKFKVFGVAEAPNLLSPKSEVIYSSPAWFGFPPVNRTDKSDSKN